MSISPAAANPRTGATVLLVDDEPSVLSALRRLLRLNGYATEQATSAAEGLKLLEEGPVDLVISDMRMPEMDGAAFLEQVSTHHPDTVRLLLTGYADMDATVAAINRGRIHRYIAKPWDDKDLLLLVKEALERRALERRNAELLALTQRQNEELQTLTQSLEQRVQARTAELEQINQMLQLAYEEVDHQFTTAMAVFSGLLEMRQGRIAGHARRVSNLAGRMARRLGMAERLCQDVVQAALLHDIGKLGYPDDMLNKPVSQYGPAELVRYHRHPIDGEAALMALERLRPAALIVRQHHERIDGRGFPDQLAGEDISLGARIVAAASDYDGLESGHMAVQVYTPEQARLAIQQGVGSHYDAKVVAALFQALQELKEEAPQVVELEVRALRPRMVLAVDLLSPKGAILLAAGHAFDEAMIRRLVDLAERFSAQIMAKVLESSVPAGMPGASTRPAAQRQESGFATLGSR
jgi:response regulator RpfG family c-di-GMP phosphodiesterase